MLWFVFVLQLVEADLPVHCTHPDILGSWIFHIGTYHVPGGVDPNCGYTAPDSHKRHRHLTPPARDPLKKELGEYWLTDSFVEEGTIRVDLSSRTSRVTGASKSLAHAFDRKSLPTGDWTMVYDEGFQVSMSGNEPGSVTHSFFAFSKYVLDTDESNNSDFEHNFANSDCSTTLLGWYKTFGPDGYDALENKCWWGTRVSNLDGVPVAPLLRHEKRMPGLTQIYWCVLAVVTAILFMAQYVRPSASLTTRRALGDWMSTPWYGSSTDHAPYQPPTVPKGVGAGDVGAGACVDVKHASTDKGMTPSSHAASVRFQTSTLWVSVVCVALPLGFAGLHVARTHGWTLQRFRSRPLIGEIVNQYRDMPQKRWKTQTPEAFTTFLKARSANTTVPLTEHSTMQALADNLMPRKKSLVGFATEENIGPVSDTRMELQALAAKLGVPVTALNGDIVEKVWGPRARAHLVAPDDHTFYDAQGHVIAKNSWKTRASFSWREVSIGTSRGVYGPNFIPAAVDQGPCGACFSVASTTMYTARAMIRHPELLEKFRKNNDRVSWRYPLQCSVYNQGCDGGYPFVVAKWASENDLVTDTCFVNNGVKRDENDACYIDESHPSCRDRFRVQDFRYIGGALGRCGYLHLCEEMIREELFKGGPLAAAMVPDGGFFSYESGVMHEMDADVEKMKEQNRASDHADCTTHECFTWSKVDHSVTIVGWGEEDTPTCWSVTRNYKMCDGVAETRCKELKDCRWTKFPYWIAQNSWGTTWGDEGFFNIGPRGHNPLHIESLTIAADVEHVPATPHRKQKQAISKI